MNISDNLLHGYQKEALAECLFCVNRKKKGIVILPTGVGKTVIFAKVCEKLSTKKILIIAHREEIIDQIKDRVADLEHVEVKSVQYIYNKPELLQQFDLLIIDEAHHATAKTYGEVIKHFDTILGFTATVNRSDKIGLDNVFDYIAYYKPIGYFVREGYLTKVESYKTVCDIEKFSQAKQWGAKLSDELVAAIKASNWLEKVTETYLNHAKKLKTVAFCADIECSKQLTDRLKKDGISAVHIDHTMKNRKQIIEDYKAGKYQVISNVSILTEGFDCQDLECVLFCRPTNSELFYTQAIGRALRRHKNKEYALILDFTDKQNSLYQFKDISGEAAPSVLDELEKKKIDGVGQEFFHEYFFTLNERRHILHFQGGNVFNRAHTILTAQYYEILSINNDCVISFSSEKTALILSSGKIKNSKNYNLRSEFSGFSDRAYAAFLVDLEDRTFEIIKVGDSVSCLDSAAEKADMYYQRDFIPKQKWRKNTASFYQLKELEEYKLNFRDITSGQAKALLQYAKAMKIINTDYEL